MLTLRIYTPALPLVVTLGPDTRATNIGRDRVMRDWKFAKAFLQRELRGSSPR